MPTYHAFSRPAARLVILILSLAATACAQPSTPADYESPKSRWLGKTPCEAPCWESITPGVDTPDGVTEKLKANPLVDQESMTLADVTMSSGYVIHTLNWGMKAPSGKWEEGQWNGKIVYDENTEADPIRSLSLTAPDVCLGDIIATYGDPDTFYLPAYAIIGELDLIWKSHGILFNTLLKAPGAEITANACGGVIFLTSVDTPVKDYPQINLLTAGGMSGDDAENFPQWNGYGTYPSKYTDIP